MISVFPVIDIGVFIAEATETLKWGDYEYITETDNEITITSYMGKGKDVVIPSEIDGLPVTEINTFAFANCSNLQTVKLPDSVREIGPSAFEGCKALESIEMKGVISIGDKAFYQCVLLADIVYSDALKSIGSNAFRICKLTETLDLSSVEKLGKNVFAGNRTIKKVILNDNLTVLEDGVFSECLNLEEINFPSELVSIGDSCFKNTGIKSAVFKGKLKEIGERAFESCRYIDGTVDLSTVEKIGEDAFGWCTRLKKVILCDNLRVLEQETFEMCVGLREINMPSELVEIKDFCFNDSGITVAAFGGKLKRIGAFAFLGCDGLTELKFPEGLTSIETDAFNACKNLSKIELPESIKKIGNFAFAATAVQVLVIPENLSVIGYGAFQNCKSLETLYFNAMNCTVDRYGHIETDLNYGNLQKSSPFYGCNIKEIYLGGGITSIGGTSDMYGAFESCTELESIIIPDTVSKIGKASFKNCSSLEIAVISDSVTSVADDAFDGCDNLTILCFEDSYIYEYAQNNGISVSTFLVSPIPNQTYTGKKITPPVTVTFSGETLHKYIDFGVTYENNINVGEADVTVKGKGDYKNFSNKTKFSIITKNIASATITPVADQAYTGKEVTPDVTVTDSSGLLCKDKDYTVSYSSNKKEGTATIVITGIGNYSGSTSVKFEIVKMNDTENFFTQILNFIKTVYIKIIAFFKGLFI